MIGICRQAQKARDWGPLSEADVADAIQLAKQAIELGKDDPDTLWMAAHCLSALAGEHAVAVGAIRRALTLNPNCAHAWMARGLVSAFSEPDAALQSFQRAMRLSPLDPLTYIFTAGMAFAHSTAGRYEEAIEWADRSLYEQPRFTAALRIKVALCIHLDRVEEARQWLERLLHQQPGMTIAGLRSYAARFTAPEFLTWYLDSLRKAGLPEE